MSKLQDWKIFLFNRFVILLGAYVGPTFKWCSASIKPKYLHFRKKNADKHSNIFTQL